MEEQNELTLAILGTIAANLERIAIAIEQVPQPAPNYTKSLKVYWKFDWDSIDAKVVAEDKHGATAVMYQGKMYVRRFYTKYGCDIWYSRSTSDSSYERLISFVERPPEVETLPTKIVEALRQASQKGR